MVLPNGQRAVTYTRQSQTGHGDHREANVEIEKMIRKTKHLQDSMHTLEEFVRRNRSLFPEDIIIYQVREWRWRRGVVVASFVA